MEGKLAETAPKKPLALTIGAAVVTLLVVLGVVSGPSVVDCFNSGQGMGQCLQGKLAESGILPPPTPAATAEVPPAPAPEAPTELGEPALDVAEDIPADIPDNLISATFGLLRAEPDGSVVIAGSGTPGAEVEIYENDDLLGKTTVESSGDWVLVPERPIAPGGAEITLAEAGKSGRAEQSFVVVINDDKSSEPLVVASTPGAISQVLQGLPAPAEAPAQLAAADPVAPPAAPQPAPAPAPQPAPQPQAEQPAAPQPAPATTAETPAQPSVTPQPVAPAPAAPAEAAPALAPAEGPAPVPVEAAPAAPQPAPAAPTAPEPAAPPAPAAPVPETPAATPAPVEVAAAPVQPTPAPVPAPAAAAPLVQPTIDAIEVEGDRAFFAGAGSEGATIRLYVEDGFVADTTVAEGRWLIEAGKVLTRPQQRVRIDMLQPGSAGVVARAEVDFVLDLPAETPPVAIAAAPEASSAGQTPENAPSDGTSAPATGETPAQGGQPAPSASSTPSQQSAAAPVPTLVAVSVGGSDAQRFASGKAIIRRGDNLWTIARRVYGEGFKYTTIYQANTGQIRDPDLIYPGQV
ncbi:LysM peptidoglycan-binding domain-containing protein, partial [Devosia sp.]|uniref:LysM peptidoglycan-binding domain-containing protein n=1 Tax=Devosia sp. TaxID=1871048 RepID=UPI002AFF75D8